MKLELITTMAIITAVIIVAVVAIFVYLYYKRKYKRKRGFADTAPNHDTIMHCGHTSPATVSAVETAHIPEETSSAAPTVDSNPNPNPNPNSNPNPNPNRPVASPVISSTIIAVKSPRYVLPEDSVLRRHFLTQLRSEIEAQLAPRPTDAVLKRHYEQLIASKMAEYLSTD